jgi:hypothetical protein
MIRGESPSDEKPMSPQQSQENQRYLETLAAGDFKKRNICVTNTIGS